MRVPTTDDGLRVLLPVVFDARGVELFGRYQLAGKLGLLCGFLSYDPDKDSRISEYFDPRARTEYFIAGLDYRAFPNALFFAEYRFANSVDALGVAADDVFVMGFQYWFSKAGSFVYP